MKRRTFLIRGSVFISGVVTRQLLPPLHNILSVDENEAPVKSLYQIFKTPDSKYKPFVRWWWNGNKVEKTEVARELKLLKDAGIAGVEINPIKFPGRTDDIGKTATQWLSDEWIDLLDFTFTEAKKIGITCDLIVGSGWPFGAEYLRGDERSQVMVIGTKRLEGPLDYEVSVFDLFKEADPAISSPFPGRQMEMMSVKLAPAILNSAEEIIELTGDITNGHIRHTIPKGKYVLYAMVKIHGFMEVIQGAPGATGPVLNHYNKSAVEKYLERMSATITQKLGPLSNHIRALFSDSLELEGSNWCSDMPTEFQKRRGYDLLPWLPFVLYKIWGMGNTWDYNHGSEHTGEFKDMIQRIRYDFELTKTELINERFVQPFLKWCRDNKIQSRVQGYGRGYYPLEGSFDSDIPECETWIRLGLGEQMSETDYRIGRAYTMINKYVSSAAHLQGKNLVSCEELTNIHSVFNESLELMKVAGDQSIISGVTHPIFHGFNYSPPDSSFPGWVIYGTFISERNPWWKYFSRFTEYKARLSAVLQQGHMFTDIAILPPVTDMWSIYGAQNELFPGIMHPSWLTFIWETIHQNGNACDYISESVISKSIIRGGYMHFGPKKYHTIFLAEVVSIEPDVLIKLLEFVGSGGRIFCIEAYPSKAPGWNNHQSRDKQVQQLVEQLKTYTDRFIFLRRPEKDFLTWYQNIQEKYQIKPYVKINSAVQFISQVRYQFSKAEMLVFVNSSIHNSYDITLDVSREIISGKNVWNWDPETGNRIRLKIDSGNVKLTMGPADLKLIVFDAERNGTVNKTSPKLSNLNSGITKWNIEARHIDGSRKDFELIELKDLKDIAEMIAFSGVLIYRANINIGVTKKISRMDLGKVFGVSELFVNGQYAGTTWYGRRIFPIEKHIMPGNNRIEINITTTLGNYMKSLTNNKVAQFWTNEGRTIQPLQSMGMIGPVTLI